MTFGLNDDFCRQLAAAMVLIPLTLFTQSVGMAGVILWTRAYFAKNTGRLGLRHCAEIVVRVTSAMIVLHIIEILLWTGFYRWKCLAALEPAFYFSATSFSTVGYGDVVLPPFWRFLGPVESVTGVLMCGLSASLLFALVTRLVGHEDRFLLPSPKPVAQLTVAAQHGAGS
jgi:voltage-gated potassium channel